VVGVNDNTICPAMHVTIFHKNAYMYARARTPTHTHTHTHTHTYTHIHKHTRTHTHTHAHTHTHTHTHTRSRARKQMVKNNTRRASLQLHMQHACMYTHIHSIHIHAHMHTCTHAYNHTRHTYTQAAHTHTPPSDPMLLSTSAALPLLCTACIVIWRRKSATLLMFLLLTDTVAFSTENLAKCSKSPQASLLT
jgi:hypothetical protein